MILRALHTRGKLDISSQEVYPGGNSIMDTVSFRLTLSPGQTVEIEDALRGLKNIDSAINAGLLEVVSYDSAADSSVAQEELNNVSGSTTHSELIDDEQEEHRLINDSIESAISLWSSDKIREEVEQLLSVFAPKIVTSDYSAQVADHILCNVTTSVVITLPESSSATEGKLIIIKNINSGIVAIDAYGDEKIDNDKTIYLSNIWESVILVNSGSSWYIALQDVGGDDWSSQST